jgi:hypothetical protein
MMRMLQAGGIPIASDGLRTADADNPHGYFELECVKSLDRDASCLEDCRSKAVKIVSLLLSALPPEHLYHIIFMERPLPEVLASQKTMLQRRGHPHDGESDSDLAASFKTHLASVKQALAQKPNTRTLYLPYQDVVRCPDESAQQVARFLNRDLNVERMARAVDQSLYRNRVS